jgi:hypothetical protein
MGVTDMLSSGMNDFVIDGNKSKSKVARHSTWYAKYKATIPGLAGLLKDLAKSDVVTILSILSHEWSKSLPDLHSECLLG